jgi:hypothetical protein
VESVGDGFTWRRQNSSVEIDEDTLDDRMRERIAAGAQNLRADAFVKVSDAHLEAKARFLLFDSLASVGPLLPGRRERNRARERSFRAPTPMAAAPSTQSRARTSRRRGFAGIVYYLCNLSSDGHRGIAFGNLT